MAGQNYVIQEACTFWKRQTSVMRGIVLMCLSTIAFSIMHGLVRFVSEVLPPFQIAFFRNVFGLAFLSSAIEESSGVSEEVNRLFDRDRFICRLHTFGEDVITTHGSFGLRVEGKNTKKDEVRPFPIESMRR